MFCPQCGREMTDGLGTCPVCNVGEVTPVIRMGSRKEGSRPPEQPPVSGVMSGFSHAASLDGSPEPVREEKPTPVFDAPLEPPVSAFHKPDTPAFHSEPEAPFFRSEPAAPTSHKEPEAPPTFSGSDSPLSPEKKKNWMMLALAGVVIALVVVLIIVLASNSGGGGGGSSSKDKDKDNKPGSSNNSDDSGGSNNSNGFGGSGNNSVPYTGTVIPDLQCYSGNRMQHYETRSVSGGSKFVLFTDDNTDFLNEYVNLLRQNFTQTGFVDGSSGRISIYEYCFIYEGEGASSLSTINAEKELTKLDGHTAVHVALRYVGGEFQLLVANGLDYADTGHRTKINLSDRSNEGNGGGGGGSDIYDADVPDSPYGCIVCDNTGEVRCKLCSGAGGKSEYVSGGPDYSGNGGNSGYVWRTCSRCNGTGKQDCSSC